MARKAAACLVPPLAAAALFATSAFAAAAPARPLTLEQRVAAERAVQEAYWNARAWPAGNPGAKPPLSSVLDDAAIRARVAGLLRESNALASRWGIVPTAAALSGELARMAAGTRAPQTLRALFDALGDDPVLEAEVLARRALVEREIRHAYARDPELHAATRRAAASALAAAGTRAGLARSGDAYGERSFHLAARTGAGEPLTEEEFATLVRRLQSAFGRLPDADATSAPAALGRLPVGRWSALVEDDDAFRAVAILDAENGAVRLATATWPKVPFSTWWAGASSAYSASAPPLEGVVHAPAAAAGFSSCSDAPPWTPTQAWGVPSPRYGHTAVWTGAEMIVWGGASDAESIGTGARYDPATDTWTPIADAGAPKGRSAHTAVWTGTRMIVWGGLDNVRLGDGGVYDPVADTWTATSSSGAPSPRAYHTAVWTGSRMIVWGGEGGGGTGASYDPAGNAWAPIAAAGAPSDRSRHAAVWTGSRMIVWGGRAPAGTALGDGALYDPGDDAWATVSPSGAPSARWGHSGVWSGSELWVWGGTSGSAALGDGARYDPVADTWIGLSASGAPSPRSDHAAVWAGARMVVWGGTDGTAPLGDGGRYDPANESWLPLAASGAPPARSLATMVWTGSRVLLFGGRDARAARADGGRYDPAADAWTSMASGPWAPSSRRSLVSISTGAELLVWGGETLDALFPEWTASGAVYDLATDTWRPMTAPDPGVVLPRETTAVWTGTEMVVWGGRQPAGAENVQSTGGRYDPALDAWTPTPLAGAPAPRSLHTAVWTGTEMIVWGGTGAGPLDSGAGLDPAAGVWTPIASGGTARYGHTAVWTGARMIAWGGIGVSGGLGGPAAIYDPGGDAWSYSAAPLPGQDTPPSPRDHHTAVWTGSRMVVWGGENPSNTAIKYGDGAAYDPALDRWFATSPTGAPGVRDTHTAVWNGSRMIVWGGTNSCCFLGDGGDYDPVANAWTPTFVPGAPRARGQHTAAAMGDAAIVWGGLVVGSRTTNTGAVYCACSWYRDADGDGYGDPAALLRDCTYAVAPAGYVADDTDCNDADPATHPGAPDASCDGIDQNCSGTADEGYVSVPTSCGTGACVSTGATSCVAGTIVDSCTALPPSPEICDGLDNDCDGVIDNTPDGSPALSIAKGAGGGADLTWTTLFSAASYDVTRGELGALRSGGFTPSVDACLANDVAAPAASDPAAAPAGDGFWYLVRGSDCAGPGTYDEGGPSQAAPRDAAIAASSEACP